MRFSPILLLLFCACFFSGCPDDGILSDGPAENFIGTYKGDDNEMRNTSSFEEEFTYSTEVEIVRTSNNNITINLTRCRPDLGEEEINLDGIIDGNDDRKFTIVDEPFTNIESAGGTTYKVSITNGSGELFSIQSLRLRFNEEYTILEPGTADLNAPREDFISNHFVETNQVGTGNYRCN